MTYAVDLLRAIYYFGKPEAAKTVLFSPFLDLTVIIGVGLIFLAIGTYLFVRNERNR